MLFEHKLDPARRVVLQFWSPNFVQVADPETGREQVLDPAVFAGSWQQVETP